MNAQEIAHYAAAAGFSGSNLATAVAIALAESRGDPRAHRVKGRDDSYGLWQINMIGEPGRPGPKGEVYGPARRTQFGITSNTALFDPATNARAAFSLSGGTRFSDWSTYNDGSYRSYMQTAVTGIGSDVFNGGGIENPLDAAGDAAKAAAGGIQSLLGLDDLGKQILTAGLAITFTVAALGLIGVGLFKLTGQDVSSVIGSGGEAAGAAGLAKAVI